MREVTTLIMSWLAVTMIFVVTLGLDGMELAFLTLNNTFMLWALVALVSGMYYVVIGLPILYVLLQRKVVSGVNFIFAGILASFPMLIISITSQEIEWVIASLIAGFVGGLIFAIRLSKEQ